MTKVDRVYEAFIEGQNVAAQTLNQASDIVHITQKKLNRGHLYTVRLLCKGLVNDNGTIKEHGQFELGIHFPEHYLRRCVAANIKPPFICLGRVIPGTQIVDIVHQAYQIITYQKVTMIETDALNHDACAWARANSDMFPVDKHPLRRRNVEFTIEEIKKEVKE